MKHRLAASAIVAGLALAWSLALNTAAATSASADSNLGPTTLAFDGTQTSLPLTDFSGRYIVATLRDKNGKAPGGNGSCNDNNGPVYFTFTNETTHAVRTVKSCLDEQSQAGASTPSSCYKAALGIRCSVSARFQANGDTFASSATTKSLTLTVSPTPVVAFANVDYDKHSPTRATIYGGLASAIGFGTENADYYDTVPDAGVWTVVLTASDGSKTFVVTPKTRPAGVDPQWAVTGLTPGTGYTAVARYSYAASDAGRHTMKASESSAFTTAGTAPSTTPTPTPTPLVTPIAQPSGQPTQQQTQTQTPEATATAVAGKADDGPKATSMFGELTPVIVILAGVVALAIIGTVVGYLIYRRRNALG